MAKTESIRSLFEKYPLDWSNLKWSSSDVLEACSLIEQEDYVEGYSILMDLADNGNAIAIFYLAKFFSIGAGIDSDIDTSKDWLTRSADAGLGLSVYYCYLTSNGEDKDLIGIVEPISAICNFII